MTSVVTFTIPQGVGQFLLDLGIAGDTVTVTAATLDVTVSGGTPTPIVLTSNDLPLLFDVDENDDGTAEAVPFETDADLKTITNTGASSVDFEVSGLAVTLQVGPFNIQLTSSDNCTVDPAANPISFPAN